MDVVSSYDTLRYTMSKFGNLMTVAKEKLSKLQEETAEVIEAVSKLQEMPAACDGPNICADRCTSLTNEKKKTRVKESNEEVEANVWLEDLRKQLDDLEIAGRAAWLQAFLYLSDYRPMLRIPLKENWRKSREIAPTFDIPFPELLKKQRKLSINSDQVPKTKKCQENVVKNVTRSELIKKNPSKILLPSLENKNSISLFKNKYFN